MPRESGASLAFLEKSDGRAMTGFGRGCL
jgi:hypothetical protein